MRASEPLASFAWPDISFAVLNLALLLDSAFLHKEDMSDRLSFVCDDLTLVWESLRHALSAKGLKFLGGHLRE
jgi:hypothetical protein